MTAATVSLSAAPGDAIIGFPCIPCISGPTFPRPISTATSPPFVTGSTLSPGTVMPPSEPCMRHVTGKVGYKRGKNRLTHLTLSSLHPLPGPVPYRPFLSPA